MLGTHDPTRPCERGDGIGLALEINEESVRSIECAFLSSELELPTVWRSGTGLVDDSGWGRDGMRPERFTGSVCRWDMSGLSSYSLDRKHRSPAFPRSWGSEPKYLTSTSRMTGSRHL